MKLLLKCKQVNWRSLLSLPNVKAHHEEMYLHCLFAGLTHAYEGLRQTKNKGQRQPRLYLQRQRGPCFSGDGQLVGLRTILTCVLELHIISVDGVLHAVGHHFQLHDLLADPHVRLGDVNIHLRVVDLASQPIAHHLW